VCFNGAAAHLTGSHVDVMEQKFAEEKNFFFAMIKKSSQDKIVCRGIIQQLRWSAIVLYVLEAFFNLKHTHTEAMHIMFWQQHCNV
jgi:hypothetical protein